MKLKKLYDKIGTEYETVLERFCNDENMLDMFVMSFPNDPTYQNLTIAINDLSYTEIENHAHALKGLSANLGFEKLQASCAKVVLCVRQNRFETLQQNFLNLKQEYESIIRGIQRIE